MVAVASINTTIRIGDRIDGRYRVIDLIADGGMGTVFLCEHVLIKRRVAVKVLHRDLAHDVLMVQRFLNEASAAGTLGHPNIVESTDMGFTPDQVPFIVFEYLDGHLLTKEVYRVGGLPVRRALRIATQIASALDAAHAAGIVHLALKCDNVFLVEREGTLDHAKVLDFGIARFLGNDLDRAEVAGTPEFMAPEQITSPAAVDERTDVYALGVVLYEMLTARRPFDDENQRALLHRIVYEPPPALDRGLPEDLELLIGSMLAKEPSARPSSMKQVIFALDELLDDLESRAVPVAEEADPREVAETIALPVIADAVGLPEAPRRGWPVGMLGLALLAGLAGGGAKLLEQRRREGLDATSVRALEADGTQLATAIEAGARTLHQRAATIAATPVLHSAIATDAATLQDLIANEHVLVAQPGVRVDLAELFAIALEAARAGLEPQQRTLGDQRRDLRVVFDERSEHFAVPRLAVLDVERRVERVVLARARLDAEPLESGIDVLGAARRGELDHAERADRLIREAPVRREPAQHVAERARLPHDVVRQRGEIEILRETRQHRAVHPAGVAAAHLVPVVPSELELRPIGQAQLGQRDEILAAGLAGDLLTEQPAQLVQRRALGAPRK